MKVNTHINVNLLCVTHQEEQKSAAHTAEAVTVNHVFFASMKFSRIEKNREIKYTRIFRNGPSP